MHDGPSITRSESLEVAADAGRIHLFNDQEISNSLLAFAKLEHVDVALLQVHTSFPHCCLYTWA
jgi:hypothetical protein